ncbi:hypothetical protein RHGRI_010219 [Rhododendron griersonianum]|uniref:Uncharacterized protein n=1 Tax=Rhododendron griersonianum TaxID=479676 RepID=A0AAV6KHZ8_9ERIC|nr:hypothetical protein RHGRI_010219 [Rhododendron griersonianum]
MLPIVSTSAKNSLTAWPILYNRFTAISVPSGNTPLNTEPNPSPPSLSLKSPVATRSCSCVNITGIPGTCCIYTSTSSVIVLLNFFQNIRIKRQKITRTAEPEPAIIAISLFRFEFGFLGSGGLLPSGGPAGPLAVVGAVGVGAVTVAGVGSGTETGVGAGTVAGVGAVTTTVAVGALKTSVGVGAVTVAGVGFGTETGVGAGTVASVGAVTTTGVVGAVKTSVGVGAVTVAGVGSVTTTGAVGAGTANGSVGA